MQQTVYIDPQFERPVLSYKCRVFTNDIKDYADFMVEIQDGLGSKTNQILLHDGFQQCNSEIPVTPNQGTDLGRRNAAHNLSPYKGKHIRITFHVRNLWEQTLGIWAYLDDVSILDKPLSTDKQDLMDKSPLINYWA